MNLPVWMLWLGGTLLPLGALWLLWRLALRPKHCYGYSHVLPLLALLLAACATNRFDHKGERQGRWRICYDSANTQPQTVGRYRHGQPVGRWRYYASAGYLEHRERYRRHGLSDITYYYPGGQLAYQGQARTVDGPKGIHFYWFGEWSYYSPAGILDSVQLFQLGKHVSSRHIPESRPH